MVKIEPESIEETVAEARATFGNGKRTDIECLALTVGFLFHTAQMYKKQRNVLQGMLHDLKEEAK